MGSPLQPRGHRKGNGVEPESPRPGAWLWTARVHPSEPHFLTFTVGMTYTGESWDLPGAASATFLLKLLCREIPGG